jgi:hypothetical protein
VAIFSRSQASMIALAGVEKCATVRGLRLGKSIEETFQRTQRYADLIKLLPSHERLQTTDLLVPEFRLHQDSQLEVYYAPFDYVNQSAKVVILGITPGWTPDGDRVSDGAETLA